MSLSVSVAGHSLYESGAKKVELRNISQPNFDTDREGGGRRSQPPPWLLRTFHETVADPPIFHTVPVGILGSVEPRVRVCNECFAALT